MPKTKLGKWSVGLIVLFFLLFALMQLLVMSGQTGGATIFDNMVLAIPGLSMGISGILAFFTGVISIIKNKERAVLVFLASAIGLFVLLFVLGEFLFPH